MIGIQILHGHWVTDEDRWRAVQAAAEVLARTRVNPAAAYADYQRQRKTLDDEAMTGPALVWAVARAAADDALTAGRYPDSAFCTIYVSPD